MSAFGMHRRRKAHTEIVMARQLNSILGGAALAALLIAGEAHAAADRTWVSRPAQTFNTHALAMDHIIGDVTVNVNNGGPMSVQVSGPSDLVNDTRATQSGDTLRITGPEHWGNHFSVWDVSKWFDYSDIENRSKLKLTIGVPRGSDVSMNKQIGDVTMGDTMGHVALETISADVRIGRVRDASVKIVGGGDVSIANVDGTLSLSVAGSGDVRVGNTGNASISIAGSGDSSLGTVGSLNADIAGSGDLLVKNVNGPVSVSMAGSGDTKIVGGKANPLKISIVGGGDFVFGGQAVDPSISAIGSGDVWIKSYTGNLSTSGMADVHIGGKDFPGIKMPPMPAAPPAPHAPPAPPAPPQHHG